MANIFKNMKGTTARTFSIGPADAPLFFRGQELYLTSGTVNWTTTNTANPATTQLGVLTTTNVIDAGRYRVKWQIGYGNSGGATTTSCQLRLLWSAGTPTLLDNYMNVIRMNAAMNTTTNWLDWSGVEEFNLPTASVVTFPLRGSTAAGGTSGGTLFVNSFKILLTRVG